MGKADQGMENQRSQSHHLVKTKNISRNTFLRNLHRLDITDPGKENSNGSSSLRNRNLHEIVRADFRPERSIHEAAKMSGSFETALRLNLNGVCVDITNHTEPETIYNTLRALSGLEGSC